jgi:mRNA interferase HigB
MRIIKEKTLTDYCKLSKNQQAVESVKAWIYEVRFSIWNNANELKAKYGNASIISSKRVVFNIKGNDYRLIVDIEYNLEIVFVVWFGTHKEYEKIDAKKVRYETSTIR